MSAGSTIGIIGIYNELAEHCAQGYHCDIHASRKKMCEYMVSLIAVGDTHKTGPLVQDQADEAHCKEKRNRNDNE